MKIAIIGTGYVGLVTGACFAEMGHEVTCLDIDESKIALLSEGILLFYEPGLEELVERGISEKRLFFTTNYEKALEGASVCFLALATPAKENGECDLSHLFHAVEKLKEALSTPITVVVKSTVPVGTCEAIQELLMGTEIVSNPEFLKEGSAVEDCMKPDRIICGVASETAAATMRSLYQSDRMLFMEIRSAELTKYAANAMLATRISFMNEISALCEKVGADIEKIRLGIGMDRRIGLDFLHAGIGYGGSCLPKDLDALAAMGKASDCPMPLLAATKEINERQRKVLGKKIEDHFGQLQGKTIAIWGLSFKPGTDDLREAPSLVLIAQLLERGALIRIYDPVAFEKGQELFRGDARISLCQDPYESAIDADAIALVTEWRQLRCLDLKQVLANMRGSAFFDGRNQYDPKEMRSLGFAYFGIGIPDKEALLCH